MTKTTSDRLAELNSRIKAERRTLETLQRSPSYTSVAAGAVAILDGDQPTTEPDRDLREQELLVKQLQEAHRQLSQQMNAEKRQVREQAFRDNQGEWQKRMLAIVESVGATWDAIDELQKFSHELGCTDKIQWLGVNKNTVAMIRLPKPEGAALAYRGQLSCWRDIAEQQGYKTLVTAIDRILRRHRTTAN